MRGIFAARQRPRSGLRGRVFALFVLGAVKEDHINDQRQHLFYFFIFDHIRNRGDLHMGIGTDTGATATADDPDDGIVGVLIRPDNARFKAETHDNIGKQNERSA